MSKKIFALLLLLCSIAVTAKDVKTGNWNVIPLPQSVEVVAKPAFVINARTTFIILQATRCRSATPNSLCRMSRL